MGKYSKISQFDSDRLIKAYNMGEHWCWIAAILNIKKQSTYNIIKTYLSTGRSEKLAKGGNNSVKLNHACKESLISRIEQNHEEKIIFHIPSVIYT